jgi:hypothetical protein
MEAASPRLSMSFQGMGQSISRCAQEQKQKTMRDKPHLNGRELTATAQWVWGCRHSNARECPNRQQKGSPGSYYLTFRSFGCRFLI